MRASLDIPLPSWRLPGAAPDVPAGFFDSRSGAFSPDIDIDISAETGVPGRGKKLYCRLCRTLVTDASQRFSFQGRPLHCRTNPAGITYYFACFHNVPGCAVYGPPTREHSWFNGYQWQIASCSQCGEHLGWAFTGETRFYGIINDKLVEEEE